MRQFLKILVASVCFAVFTARAAHTQAQLLLSADTASAGSTVLAGVKLTMEPGWHTYWKNPGAAGQATEIKWTLPPGVTAGEVQWPLPKKLPPADITTYGYEEEVVLLVPLTLEKNLAPGALNLSAKISWLECKDSCVPAKAEVTATLNVGNTEKISADQATLADWQAKVPKIKGDFTALAFWEKPPGDDARPLLIKVAWLPPGAKTMHATADFFPATNDDFEVQAEVVNVLDLTNELVLTKLVKKISGEWPKELSGVLVLDDAAYEVTLPVTDGAAVKLTTAGSAAAKPPVSLWLMLGYAFLGGLILNVMPCVLPVIALKILGFVSEAKNDAARVRKLGFLYTLGVLMSFLALAALVIGVKAAGHKAAWGMQFDSPVFIVLLTTLVTLIAMNLFGVFEVVLHGGTMDAANQLASRSGAGGAFFNGVLATVLATPCTAPILGTALGFAFAQPDSVLVIIFLAVGGGLAAPYLILSWNPAWLKFLPKPGAWMEKFKIAMGFPMLATVVWLLSIAASSYGKDTVWLSVFLVFVATAAWVFGEFAQRGRKHKVVAAIVALVILAAGYSFALEKQLNWRQPLQDNSTGELTEKNGFWKTWSPEAVAQARANRSVVLVDFTADWCLTCRVNAQTSLDIASVRNKLKAINAVALKGDYTHFPDRITAELNRYSRAGVPLVLIYPRDPSAPPFVLPEVLTPGIVLDRLEAAAQ